MKTRETPPIPRGFDDLLYMAMIDAVGETLAFRAVDAAWTAIVNAGQVYIRRDGATSGNYTLLVDLGRTPKADS
jgi:hypothetical protein